MFKRVKNKLTDCIWVTFSALMPYEFAVKTFAQNSTEEFQNRRLTARRNSLNFPETFMHFNINLPWGFVYLYALNITFISDVFTHL